MFNARWDKIITQGLAIFHIQTCKKILLILQLLFNDSDQSLFLEDVCKEYFFQKPGFFWDIYTKILDGDLAILKVSVMSQFIFLFFIYNKGGKSN